MKRALDFTPSTDYGQRYFDYKHGIPDEKASRAIGYAPAFL